MNGTSPRLCCLGTAVWFLLISQGSIGAQSASGSGEKLGEELLSQGRYRQALEQFEALIEQEEADASPERLAKLHHGRGSALVGEIRYREAATAFERALALDPERLESWSRLLTVRTELAEREGVLSAFEKRVELAPLRREELLPTARALRRSGWTDEARELLQAIPDPDAEELLELGRLLRGEAKFDEARDRLTQATSGGGASASVYYELALCLEALGEPMAAIDSLHVALEKDPNLRPARFRLGNLLLRHGAPDEGQQYLQGYEAFRQWDRRVKLLLSMVSSGGLSSVEEPLKRLELVRLLVQGGDREQASQVLRASMHRFPRETGFALEEARLLWLDGRGDEARERLIPLLANASRSFEVDWLVGRIDLEEQRLSRAVDQYRVALSRTPSPPVLLRKEAGTAFAMSGDLESARAQFEAALEAEPARADIHADLALVYEMRSDFVEAERAYQSSLKLDPDFVAAQQGLGGLLLARGEAEAALALFQKSVELNPKQPALYRSLAAALTKLGRHEDAAAARERAVELETP